MVKSGMCVTINNMDETLKIEMYPYVSPGGQQVSVVRTGVKITHIPTGTVAICEHARSQIKNKNIALKMIETALEDF